MKVKRRRKADKTGQLKKRRLYVVAGFMRGVGDGGLAAEWECTGKVDRCQSHSALVLTRAGRSGMGQADSILYWAHTATSMTGLTP